MSISPSLPPGAPSLAEVLIKRTFTKPTQPFVDREFIEALSHVDEDQPSVTTAATATGATATGAAHDAPAPASPTAAHGPSIDVRV
jgi:hypothetical protein